MKAKKVMALVLCAAMVSGLAATTVMAAPEDQFDGLTANEAYEFPMMVKSFQSTYWEAAMKGMDKAAEELGRFEGGFASVAGSDCRVVE